MKRLLLITIVLLSLSLSLAGCSDLVNMLAPTPVPAPLPQAGTLRVAFLDIGQGDAILVRAPNGMIMLIDGGHSSDDGTQVILPKLREWGAKQVDLMVATHPDADHIGGLPEIVTASARKVEVLAHPAEKPYIQGDEIFIKRLPVDNSPEVGHVTTTVKPAVEPFARAKVTRLVTDGQVLPYCGGITVIHTPGHTPGHICLFHKQSRTLISGDALNVVNGQLTGPNPQHTHDLDIATKSLKKLSMYDIQSVICYHGGLYRGAAKRHIAELANGYCPS